MLTFSMLKSVAATFVIAAASLGLAPTGTPFGADAAQAQGYRYRSAPAYRYRSMPTYRYRAPHVPNRVERGIQTLSRWNGNAERRARWAARRGH